LGIVFYILKGYLLQKFKLIEDINLVGDHAVNPDEFIYIYVVIQKFVMDISCYSFIKLFEHMAYCWGSCTYR